MKFERIDEQLEVLLQAPLVEQHDTGGHNQQLEGLFKVATILSGYSGFNNKCSMALDEAAKVVGADQMAIRLINRRENNLTLVANSEQPEAISQTIPIHGLASVALDVRAPVVVNDYLAFRGTVPDRRSFGVRSAACYPIMIRAKFVGVLNVSSRDPNHFKTEHLRFINALTEQIATVVENNRLHNQAEELTKEIGIISELARVTAPDFDPREVYERIVTVLQRLIKFDQAKFHIVDPRMGLFDIVLEFSGKGKAVLVEPLQNTKDAGTWPIMDPSGPNQYDDIFREPRESQREAASATDLRSCVILPLISGRFPLSTITIWSWLPKAYGKQDHALLQMIEPFISAAIDKAILLEEIKVQRLTQWQARDAVISVGRHSGGGSASELGCNILGQPPGAGSESYQKLSTREKEILTLVGEGYSNKDIFARLKIKLRTAGTHRFNLMRKLGVHCQAELLGYLLASETIKSRPTTANRSSVANDRRITGRERDIIQLLLEGCSNQEMADSLHLSPMTVRNYIGKLLIKFSAKNRTDLLAKYVSSRRSSHRSLLR